MNAALHSRLAELYRELAAVHAELARESEDRLRPESERYVDQHHSPLGSRLHCKLVRAGVLTGRKAGRRILVRVSEIEAYLEENRIRTDAPPVVRAPSEDDEIMAKLNRPRRRAA